MKEFLNRDKTLFKYCSMLQLRDLFEAGYSNCQILNSEDNWEANTEQSWCMDSVYRTTPEPKRMPSYPWHVLSDEVVACSFDKNYRLIAHETANVKIATGGTRHESWDGISYVTSHIKFDCGTVDWRDSLQMRPITDSVKPDLKQYEQMIAPRVEELS
jgi:hypothetical protein